MDPIEKQIREKFKDIPYGDEGSNVLDSNVVYSLEIEGENAEVVLIIPQKFESTIGITSNKVEDALKTIDNINNVTVSVIDEKEMADSIERESISPETIHEKDHANPHDPEQPHLAAPQNASYLDEYKHVILIASGKGGVGKSTLSVNLALALKHIGKKVSLLDVDVYGPSIPVMLGARDKMPRVIGHKILPLTRCGIEFMSMGNLVPEAQSMIWRGPMIHQAVEQLLRDTQWPGGDYMIVDLPPGTGDVQISLAQTTQAAGAIVVCTPQDVALLDARKAINMFNKVNIPLIGMVENLSFFICPECGTETPIFSTGGAEKESETQEVPFLGKVPIELDIRVGGDKGEPVVHADPKSKSAGYFIEIAKKVDELMEEDE